jgi:hypothetical protein
MKTKQTKVRFDIIFHWKLFDIIEHLNGDTEVSVFFVKMLFFKSGRVCYYVDSCGVGLDFLSNAKYTSIMIKLIAFSLSFQFAKRQNLRLL